jgi:hypothetical protein
MVINDSSIYIYVNYKYEQMTQNRKQHCKWKAVVLEIEEDFR